MGGHRGRFIGLWLEEAEVRLLDQAAKAAGLSRSEMVRQLILAGLGQGRGGNDNDNDDANATRRA